jgi:hypothetical protein
MKFGGIAIAIFWSGATLLFLTIFLAGEIRSVCALGYPTAKGTIGVSRLARRTDSDGTSFAAEIDYVYTVDGHDYAGNTVRYQTMTGWSKTYAESDVLKHPSGSETLVRYNPSNIKDTVLEAGISGGDLVFLLFITPFVAAAIYLWLSVIVFIVSPGKPAGGAPIRDDGTTIRAFLPRASAVMYVLLAVGAGAMVELGIVGLATWMNPPIGVIGICFALLVGAAWATYRWRTQRRELGLDDLVLDRRTCTVTLPANFGRKRPLSLAVGDLTGIEVDLVAKAYSDGGKQRSYAVSLKSPGLDALSARLIDWYNKDSAEAFASWLRERLNELRAGNTPLPVETLETSK